MLFPEWKTAISSAWRRVNIIWKKVFSLKGQAMNKSAGFASMELAKRVIRCLTFVSALEASSWFIISAWKIGLKVRWGRLRHLIASTIIMSRLSASCANKLLVTRSSTKAGFTVYSSHKKSTRHMQGSHILRTTKYFRFWFDWKSPQSFR
jgi:hypothetical protein